MKQSTGHKILGFLFFLMAGLPAYAQAKTTIEIDTLSKIIGIIFTLGGIFMGYMQMKMASKIAEMEAKFNKALTEIKEELHKTINAETDKLEDKIRVSQKEIEARMATHHDIRNINALGNLQHEIIKEQLKGLKESISNIKEREKAA